MESHHKERNFVTNQNDNLDKPPKKCRFLKRHFHNHLKKGRLNKYLVCNSQTHRKLTKRHGTGLRPSCRRHHSPPLSVIYAPSRKENKRPHRDGVSSRKEYKRPYRDGVPSRKEYKRPNRDRVPSRKENKRPYRQERRPARNPVVHIVREHGSSCILQRSFRVEHFPAKISKIHFAYNVLDVAKCNTHFAYNVLDVAKCNTHFVYNIFSQRSQPFISFTAFSRKDLRSLISSTTFSPGEAGH